MNQQTRIAAAPVQPIDYSRPPGEEAFCDPGSVQWRVFKNPFALVIGAAAAVLLEFADPRIRSGVWNHSVYAVDPIGRSKRTMSAALLGVYGPKSVTRSVVAAVNRMHAKVAGVTPRGDAYHALDPELLNWVYATAQYGFLNAYCRFVEPLSQPDKRRFWLEGRPIAQLYGVTDLPRSDEEFLAVMDRLLPRFESHPIVFDFLDIIVSGRARPELPRFIHLSIARAAISLVPQRVRETLSLGREWDMTMRDRIAIRIMARLANRQNDQSPAWQAALRLGLPGNHAWR